MFHHRSDPDAPRTYTTWGAFVRGSLRLLVVGVVCTTGVVLYGMRIADRRAGELLGVARGALDDLPAFMAALPPVLADAVHDERRPDYAKRISVQAELGNERDQPGARRPVVTIRNTGDEVVSLLALQVTVFDDRNTPIAEYTEYGATPLAGGHGWRGPLMPNEERYVIVNGDPHRRCNVPGGAAVRVAISDIRVWTPIPPSTGPDAAPADAPRARTPGAAPTQARPSDTEPPRARSSLRSAVTLPEPNTEPLPVG